MDTLHHTNSFQPNHTAKRFKANAISFWAFLLSIFIYISIFYVFSLSPSTLLNTNKFWFLVSNTLIIIIAADFGAYSSSKKHDLHEEYLKNIRPKQYVVPSSFEFQYSQPKFVAAKKTIPPLLQSKDAVGTRQEKIKEVVVVHETKCQQENTMATVVIKKEEHKEQIKPSKNPQVEKVVQFTPKDDVLQIKEAEARPKKMKKTELAGSSSYVRCRSDNAIVLTSDVNRPVLRRSRSHTQQKHEQEAEQEGKIEENEFSNMSNEELNRRVEEFIQNFNRQIRLQASRNFASQL